MNSNTEINPKLGLGVALFECMKKYNGRVLQYLADTDETDTFEQVLARCIRTALKLKEKGIRRNDVISACTHNQKNACVPMIAAFFLGAIPTNFDANLPPLDAVHLLEVVRPKIMFVSADALTFMEKCVGESGTATELVVFGDSRKYSQFSEYLAPHPEELNFRAVSVEDSKETAIIMFSSGTTGLPKGICLNHYSLLKRMRTSNLMMVKNDDARGVVLTYTTFYWISSVGMFLETVLRGDSFVLCSKFDAVRAWKLIEKYKVTFMFLAPLFASDFLRNRQENVNTNSLRNLLTGGSAVTKDLMEGLQTALPSARIINGYGQTESSGFISKFDSIKPEEREMMISKPMSCGKVIPILQWKVVDPDSEKIFGPNEKGELRVKSDCFMNGYYNMDSSITDYDSEGYLKTGDIVYYDEDECLYVVGRIKEMFKYKSWHIIPAVLEGVLMSNPAVKEAAVIGIPHGIEGDHPMGIVVLHKECKNVSPEEIEKFVAERVPNIQKLRAGVKVVEEILRTPTGKIRRNDVRSLILEGKI